MGIQKPQGEIDTSALEAELNQARGVRAPRAESSSPRGKSVRDMVIEQKDLPEGPVTFVVLPTLDNTPFPWVRWAEHFFFHDGSRKWAKFNCVWRMSNGASQCPGCDFLQRLNREIVWKLEKLNDRETTEYFQANPSHRGVEKFTKKGKAKVLIGMNIVFTSWLGGPVPENMQGVKVFKASAGIWKGTSKNQLGGMALILQDCPDMADPENALEVRITKTLGAEPLDTNYLVEPVQTDETVQINNKPTKVKVDRRIPIGSSPAQIKELLGNRGGLGIFTLMRTEDEMAQELGKVDCFDLAAPPAPRQQPAPQARSAPPRTAQQAVDTEAFKSPGSGDDIPW